MKTTLIHYDMSPLMYVFLRITGLMPELIYFLLLFMRSFDSRNTKTDTVKIEISIPVLSVRR